MTSASGTSGAVRIVTTNGLTAGVLHSGAGEPAEHSPRPYLHPVLTPGGAVVSDYQPADHPWHWGLGITVSTIDVLGQDHPVNLWGGPTYIRGEGYREMPSNGSQRETSRETTAGGLVQRVDWHAANGEQFLSEERTWSARSVMAGGVEWICTTARSSWANCSAGPLTFGSPTTSGRPAAGYGGFFLRLAPTFDGAEILVPDDTAPGGTVSIEESDAMGACHGWMAMRSADASVLMVSGGQNPRSRTPWFVRSAATPMLCAAPFFHETWELAAGGVVDWAWSWLTADGRTGDTIIRLAAEAAVAELSERS